jgi:hypothetical protein
MMDFFLNLNRRENKTKRKRLATARMHHSLNKLTKNEENKL